MRELHINLNDSQLSYEAGYIAEHNATKVCFILTDEMFNSEANAFIVRFANDLGTFLSKSFTKTTVKNKTVSLPLWQELTRCENLSVTVEGYKDKSLIMKSQKIKFTFDESVDSTIAATDEKECDNLLQDIVKKNTIIDESEVARAQNEDKRIASEETRNSAESERVENETARQEAEVERSHKEAIRLSAEDFRVENETARQNAEVERIAENKRVETLINSFVGDMPIANTATPGAVKAGGDITVSSDGTVSILPALKKIYPIGTVQISMTNTNPSTYLGFGTWTQFAQGRTLVGVNTTDVDFNASGKTGGEKSHKLTIAEMPKHSSKIRINIDHFQGDVVTGEYLGTGLNHGECRRRYFDETDPIGGDQPHNNIQPYVTVYFWQRTA